MYLYIHTYIYVYIYIYICICIYADTRLWSYRLVRSCRVALLMHLFLLLAPRMFRGIRLSSAVLHLSNHSVQISDVARIDESPWDVAPHMSPTGVGDRSVCCPRACHAVFARLLVGCICSALLFVRTSFRTLFSVGLFLRQRCAVRWRCFGRGQSPPFVLHRKSPYLVFVSVPSVCSPGRAVLPVCNQVRAQGYVSSRGN